MDRSGRACGNRKRSRRLRKHREIDNHCNQQSLTVNIIIPMAGMGKRMRPHTLTTPKPLIPVAGKPMVQRIVEDIIQVCDEPVEEIAYVVGRFGKEAENNLIAVANKFGAKGSIWYQDEP